MAHTCNLGMAHAIRNTQLGHAHWYNLMLTGCSRNEKKITPMQNSYNN